VAASTGEEADRQNEATIVLWARIADGAFIPPSAEAARRAALAVASMRSLSEVWINLFQEHDGPIFPPPAPWELECRAVVDALFEALASPNLNPSFEELYLHSFGRSSESWRRFINRFGPSIKVLAINTEFIMEVETMAAQVSRSLRTSSQFCSLETIIFQSACSPAQAEAVKALLRAVTGLTQIATLVVAYNAYPEPEKITSLVRCVADVAARLPSTASSFQKVCLDSLCDASALPDWREVLTSFSSNIVLSVSVFENSVPPLCAVLEANDTSVTNFELQLKNATLS
jgi:hypothetical protein